MYHIGFFYHLPMTWRSGANLVLGYNGNKFRFYLVSNSIIPRKYRDMTSHYTNLSFPILFKADGDNANEIYFLADILKDESKNGNCFHIVKDDDIKASLITLNGRSIFDIYPYTEKEAKLLNLLLIQFLLMNEIADLRSRSTMISSEDVFREYKWKSVISDYKKYLDSIDIKSVVSSLYVKVWDYHKTKVGGDDSYYVYRNAQLKDGSVVTDEYLNEIIGLGTVCIEQESGYTSYFPRPNIPFGVYTGDILEAEKQRIISKYSKEEHMAWLFYHQLFKQRTYQAEITKLQKTYDEVRQELESSYNLFKISKVDERFFTGRDNLLNVNKFMYRVQEKKPKLNVIISGGVPYGKEVEYRKKIRAEIEKLCNDYFVIIITGRAEGAETIALYYALDEKIEFVNEYTMWTMLGKDKKIERAKSMAERADLILLTDTDNYLTKNFKIIATELNIPIRTI